MTAKLNHLLLLLLCVGLCLVVSHVNAGCISGLKRMFGKESSYAILAEHLHSAAPSSELEANTAAARSFRDLIEDDHKKGINLKSLVGVFAELYGGDDDQERLCGMANLANLRLVAEAMREDGNLGAKSLSEPIRRLNRIIIKLTVKARRVCLIHRDSKWLMQAPRAWRPPFSAAKNMFLQLDELPETFARESYLFSDGPSYVYDKNRLGHLLSTVLELSALREAKESDPLSRPELATDTNTIAEQLENHVLAPCAELESLPQSQSILVPYYNLLASVQIIDGSQANNFMKKFYESSGEQALALEPAGNNEDVQRIAYQLRTCTILRQLNKKQLIKLVARERSHFDSFAGLDDNDDDAGTQFNTAGIGGIVG